ncbi:MAG: hypothetical protein KIG36_02865 [Eubacteriales bacterium]|nr:hypothetical protein [Eubacteriales bacterium]
MRKSIPILSRLFAVFLVLMMSFLTACQVKTDNLVPDTPTVIPSIPDTESGATRFEYSLANHIEESMGGALTSYMVSPVSFQYALGMLLAGSDGETRVQLALSLGVEESAFEEHIKRFNSFVEWYNNKKTHDTEEYNRLSEDEKRLCTKPGGALRVADSVWKHVDFSDFLDEYKLRLEMYDAEYFSFKKSDVIDRVNAWANEKTEGMIPKLLPENYNVSDLAVVLMNALYYKNGWKNEFTDAGEREFTTISGEKEQKKFITSVDRCRYYKDDKTELVMIPMQDNVFVTFVLGSTEDLDRKIAEAEYKTVRVFIPKFEIESTFDNGELVNFLKKRGAIDVFDAEKANLGRMFDPTKLQKNLFVGDIVQKTKIKLDETGVEAAAVTAIMVYNSAVEAPEAEFTADKPFRFFVCSNGLPADDHTTENELWRQGFILFEGLLAG